MIQRARGTDDLEHKFPKFCQKNANSTMTDTRGMTRQQTGFRSTNFTRNLKTSSSGDKCAYVRELQAEQKENMQTNDQLL